ncbi:MAG: FHA domain-containing protein [Litoreibacter sp.]|nr:FHA domain-containing protein [Litoreibacter sp.]MCY4335172.1 FHA domain-containing protein [Litoreibacter sp.]
MTLFKKVFDTHYSENAPEFDDKNDEALEFDEIDEDLLFDEDELDDQFSDHEERMMPEFAKALGQEPAAMSQDAPLAPELPSAPASVAPVAPQSRAIKPDFVSQRASEKPAVTQPLEPTEENLSLAERAAKAHALIQSQGGKSSQPLKPSGTPLKLEQRVAPASETPDVVPLRSEAPPAAPEPVEDTAEQPARKSTRARTRLLGFHSGDSAQVDPMQAAPAERAALASIYPTGWLVITDGPGQGHSFAIQDGVSTVGRGDDQTVVLDFGDNSISRQSHAAVAYDAEQNKFFLGHGGKSNIIRLNNQPVLSTEELSHEDVIRIGETTLRFVAFCGEGFKWERS